MLLSRVAESLYWINRYLERAENISRFVEVSEAMALDCPPGSAEPWLSLIDVTGDRESFDLRFPEKKQNDVINFLIRDRQNPNSIISCINMARENARQIRDVITSEMWEQINILYWNLQEDELFWNQPSQEQLTEIRRGCQLFYGITDATLSKDLSWQFSMLGRLIERADKTSRILDVKYYLLLPSLDELGGVLDELQWISLLRSAGAYQMFRKAEQNSIRPNAVARFLLLDPIFPRSIRFCLDGISDTLQVISFNPIPGEPTQLDCMRGLLKAKWSYIRIESIMKSGLHEAIDNLQIDLNKLHKLIHQQYFSNQELTSQEEFNHEN